MRAEQLIEDGERLLAIWGLRKVRSIAKKRAQGVYEREGRAYIAAIRVRIIPVTESDDMVFTFKVIDELRASSAENRTGVYCFVVWHEKDGFSRGLAFDAGKGEQIPTWEQLMRGYRVKIRKLEPHCSNDYIFREFHGGTFQSHDLDALEAMPGSTEGERITTYRKKQQKFREALLERTKCCEVTGMQDSRLLRAAHILPWCYCDDRQRLDANNGLLLSPNYDAAFDKNLISFRDDGSILISKSLSRADCHLLGISPEAQIQVSDARESYLRLHRDRFYELDESRPPDDAE